MMTRASCSGSPLPGAIDQRVRDQLIAESRGQPARSAGAAAGAEPGGDRRWLCGGQPDAAGEPHRAEPDRAARDRCRSRPGVCCCWLPPIRPGTRTCCGGPAPLLGLGPENIDVADGRGALVVGARVGFRHPLVRSAVYRSASPEDLRGVHAALAEATYADRDPDRRAWHRASATLGPDEEVAADLERSAARARTRGGAAAAAAFLERLGRADARHRAARRRLIAAAEAKHDAGAPERGAATARQRPRPAADPAAGGARSPDCAPVPATPCAGTAAVRDSCSRPRRASRRSIRVLARDTYIEALAAAIYGGRLGDADVGGRGSRGDLDATADDESDRARDLIPPRSGTARGQGSAGGDPNPASRAAGLPRPASRLARDALGVVCVAGRAGLWDATRSERSPTARSSSPGPTAS